MDKTCVIIGAGHAAAQLAPTLRQQGWQDRILVIGEEPYLPYHRPPLSKAMLAGEKTLEESYIRPGKVYSKDDIEFMLDTRVMGIDRDNRQLLLANGEQLQYAKLALTTGSRVRELTIPGADLDGVCYLRNYYDLERIRPRIIPGHKAVIIGGGYIGLEVAAVLNKLGMEVTVLEMMERVLQRVTAAPVSEFFTRVHGEEGVQIVCGVGVEAITGNSGVEQVIASDGGHYTADLVVVGVGILPNVELAEAAGLEVDNGIVVDEYSLTADVDIVAAGDCTCHYNKIYDRWIRLESVQNASDQSRTAAATLCGKDMPYATLPWFWSDQYDLKLQIAGLSQGYNEVVMRGDSRQGRSFAAFYLRAGAVIAIDAINRPPEFMLGKRLITEQKIIDKSKLADVSVPMKELLG